MKKRKIKQKRNNLLEVLSVLNEATGNFIEIKKLLEKMVQKGLEQKEIESFKDLISNKDTLNIRDNNYEQDPELINFIYKNREKIETGIKNIATKLKQNERGTFLDNAVKLFGTETINLSINTNDTYNKFWKQVFPLYADVHNAQEEIRNNIENSQELREDEKKRVMAIFNKIIEKKSDLRKSFNEFLKNNNLQELYIKNPFYLQSDKRYTEALETYIKTETYVLKDLFDKYANNTTEKPSSEKPSSAISVLKGYFSPGKAAPTRVTGGPTGVTGGRASDYVAKLRARLGKGSASGSAELQESLQLKKLSLKEAMEKEYD